MHLDLDLTHFHRMIKVISHIIPPKVPIAENAIEFTAIDVSKTVGVASTAHLYLFNETNIDSPPECS